MQPIGYYRHLVLENGLEITVHDTSRVYFGDYHIVRLEIYCRPAALEAEPTIPADSSAKLFRVLEKMGVPSAEMETVRETLLDDFFSNSLKYISTADFPAKLANSTKGRAKPARRFYLEKS